MFNRFNNLGKKIRTEEDLKDTKKVSATPISDKEKARKKLLKIVGIISNCYFLNNFSGNYVSRNNLYF